MSNFEINLNGKVSEYKTSISKEKVLELSNEIEKNLNEIIKDNKLYRFNEFEKIVKELGFDVTRRTIDYYIKEGLLDEMMIPSGKKQGYLTANHIYKYITIAVMRDSSVSMKNIKKAISCFKNDELKDIVLTIVTIREEHKNLINSLMSQLDEIDESNFKEKLMMTIINLSHGTVYKDIIVPEFNKLLENE